MKRDALAGSDRGTCIARALPPARLSNPGLVSESGTLMGIKICMAFTTSTVLEQSFKSSRSARLTKPARVYES